MCDVSTKEKTNGTRLRRLLLDGGTQVLREVFDNIHSNSALPGILKTHEAVLKKKCFPDQIKLLFPADGRPDSETFDITLLALLLSNICSLKEPSTGWGKEPKPDVNTKEANIVRIKLFRNKIQHLSGSGISDEQFEELWDELCKPLTALGLPEDEIKNLKVKPIDDDAEIQKRFQELCDHEKRIENLEVQVNQHGVQIKELQDFQDRKKHETVIRSCIPDEPSSFIGRENELEEILSAKTNDEKPFVLVYGMAGIGKSTLIKKASWDLDKTHKKTVYFVDLCRCKATEEDISKTINYKLHRGMKVENEPREELNIWARNLQQDVILVLDNADVLISQPQTGNDGNNETSNSCLLKILLELREFSSQKLNYLIASREVLNFDATDVSKKEIALKPFEVSQSLKFINRHCSSGLTDNHKQEIVKLCSNIPLALHITIPLLEDYSPEELIEKLKSRPMEDVLEPLKRALDLSFDKLDETLRDYFVKLTVFSGYFTADSAMAVIGVSTKNDAVDVLKKLSTKSLLQNENRKYSLHPFIHEFVVDYASNNDAKRRLLEEGRSNFLNHYQSLLLKNTKSYWTKDSCQQSLSAFVEDRVNFEKALEILLDVKVLDLNEPSMENTKKILIDKELTNVVMYLESCTSWDLLRRLMGKFIMLAGKNNLSSRELESLCWKGHFARRQGEEKEYEELMERADKIYNSGEADGVDDRATVCYKSAKGRYLSHKDKNDQAVKIFEEIKEFCMERVDNDPGMNEDYARAIVELGHNLKHKKEYRMAVDSYKQASVIYVNYLGQHIKTALSFKDMADGYLIQETQDDYNQALQYYDKAIDMLTKLRSDSETHMILLLKNTGICNRKLCKYQESENHFMKAMSIAENNLKENHKYKCWVMEELAYLYDDMKERGKARSFAKKANEMAKTLNLKSGNWLEDKEGLQEIPQ